MQVLLHTQFFMSWTQILQKTTALTGHTGCKYLMLNGGPRQICLMWTLYFVIIAVTMEWCLLLYIWQLSLFTHTAWQSDKPLNKQDSKSFCYNNTQPSQPIRTAKEWCLSLLIRTVAIAGAQLVQSPCMLVLCLYFAGFQIKLNVISLCLTGRGPQRPLEGGEGATSRKHWGWSLDLELNPTHL